MDGVSVGMIVFICNIPLFIAGFLAFGKRFSIKTFIATALLSISLDNTLWLPQITDDMLLAPVVGWSFGKFENCFLGGVHFHGGWGILRYAHELQKSFDKSCMSDYFGICADCASVGLALRVLL